MQSDNNSAKLDLVPAESLVLANLLPNEKLLYVCRQNLKRLKPQHLLSPYWVGLTLARLNRGTMSFTAGSKTALIESIIQISILTALCAVIVCKKDWEPFLGLAVYFGMIAYYLFVLRQTAGRAFAITDQRVIYIDVVRKKILGSITLNSVEAFRVIKAKDGTQDVLFQCSVYPKGTTGRFPPRLIALTAIDEPDQIKTLIATSATAT